MLWRDIKPFATDIPDMELASLFTTQKIAFRTGIEKHYYWTQSSGLSAGIPSLTTGPGSARAFYGPQSQVSAAPSAKFLVTSDTSRIFVLTSSMSYLGGSSSALAYGGDSGSSGTIASGSRWLVQGGTSIAAGATSGTIDIVFPTAHSVAPHVLISPVVINFLQIGQYGVLRSRGTDARIAFNNNSASTTTLLWRSEGTVAL